MNIKRVNRHNDELREFCIGDMLSCHAYNSYGVWFSSSIFSEPIRCFIVIGYEFMSESEGSHLLDEDELCFTVKTESGLLVFIKEDLVA